MSSSGSDYWAQWALERIPDDVLRSLVAGKARSILFEQTRIRWMFPRRNDPRRGPESFRDALKVSLRILRSLKRDYRRFSTQLELRAL